MKVTLLLCLGAFSTFAQDTLQHTSPVPGDTVDIQREVEFTPDGAARSIRSLPYYVVPVTDPRLREASMGMSVLNTLRGQVAGLFVSPQFVTTNPFGPSTLMVVDGAPVNSDIASLSNLNTFDYQLPTVITGNAGAYYGMYGGANGVILQSRSGEGYDRGTFIFNTYNTSGNIKAPDGTVFEGQKFGLLRLSNSLAYAKDFGAVDLRVSANYTFNPEYTDLTNPVFPVPIMTRLKNTNLKVNAGWNITSKLRARFIAEKNSETTSAEIRRTNPTTIDKFQNDYGNTRTNLSLEYDAKPWLKFSSLLQKSSIDRHQQFYPYAPVDHYTHDRNLFNLFANFHKQLTSTVALSASTGIQRDKAKGSFPYYINSQLNTVGVSFKDQLFVDGTFRFDKSDIDPDKSKQTWSLATGWLFSELMKTGNGFPYGKLRASVGRYSYANMQFYPQVITDMQGRFPEKFVDASKQSFRYELGTDLLFWNGRVQFTFNYVRLDAFNHDPVTDNFESGNVTVQWTHVDRTRHYTDQQQLAVGAYLNGSKTAFSKLLVTTTQQREHAPAGKTRNVTDGQPFYVSFLQTASVGEAVLNLLFETYSSGKKVQAWGLRELSVGYPVARRFAERRSVHPPMISVIGRGLMDGDGSEDVTTTNGMTRSVSIGFTISL